MSNEGAPEGIRLVFPMAVVVDDRELPRRGLVGAIYMIPDPDTGELVLQLFTDPDLAGQAVTSGKGRTSCIYKVEDAAALRSLLHDFIARGGNLVAIDPIPDGRHFWEIIDAGSVLAAVSR